MSRLYGPGHFTEDPYAQVVSPHGIAVDDLVAVLQKEIRRSRIDNAVLAAYEMLTTSTDVAQHLWHGRSKIVLRGWVAIRGGVLRSDHGRRAGGEGDEAPVGTGVLSQIPAAGASPWVSLSFLCCRVRAGRPDRVCAGSGCLL